MFRSFRVIVMMISMLIGILLFLYRDINRIYNEANMRYLGEVLCSAWNSKINAREFDVIANLGFVVGIDQDTNLYWGNHNVKEICGKIKLDSFSCYPEVEYRIMYDIQYDNKSLRLDDLYDLCIANVIDDNLRNTIVAVAVIDSMDNVILVSNDVDLKFLCDKRINRTSGFVVGHKYNHRVVLYAKEMPIYNVYSTSMLMVICFSFVFTILSGILLCYALKLNKNMKIRKLQFSYLKHEVLKPLTMLAERVAFISEEENNTKLVDVKNCVDKIINASDTLLATDSEFNVDRTECNVQELIQSVIEIYGTVYRNVKWSVNVDEQVDKQLLDKRGMLMVISNIIDNAIKYNDKAIPEISVSCVGKDNLFEMKITDNGPGIEKCYLKKIFISYFRIPTNIKKMKTGMGIGLPLAKKIVNAHGGEIWAESEFGKGCCIVVQIPIFDYGT